jgi:hypothetical protein
MAMFKKFDKASARPESDNSSEQVTSASVAKVATTFKAASTEQFASILDAESDEDSQYQQPPQRLTLMEMLMMENEVRRGSNHAIKSRQQRKPLVQSNSEHIESEAFRVPPIRGPQQVGSLHQRNESLHVTWTAEAIQRMTNEIYNETIASVHLSLLGYWIIESVEHYDVAKEFIRELSLDQVSQVLLILEPSCLANTTTQGYNVNRIKNAALRNLLISTRSVRPV